MTYAISNAAHVLDGPPGEQSMHRTIVDTERALVRLARMKDGPVTACVGDCCTHTQSEHYHLAQGPHSHLNGEETHYAWLMLDMAIRVAKAFLR